MICQTCRQQVRQHVRQQLAGVHRPLSNSTVPSTTRSFRAAAPACAAAPVRALPAAATRRRQPIPTPLVAPPFYRPYSASSAEAKTPASSDTPASSTSALEKPDFLDEAESHIWDLLSEAFAPVELAVRDISGGCGSMYGIEISSDKFRGANMLKQQRMVNAVLGDLVKGWHGVQLKTRVP